MTEQLRRPVLLYDGGCRFCRFAARAVATLDRGHELAFLPMDESEAERLLAPLPEDERLETWHLVAPDGALSGRGTGGAELLGALRLTRPVGELLARAPHRMLEGAYEIVARHRKGLGRFVPDRPGPRRYP